MMRNVLTTYFLNGAEIVGKLDTCELMDGGFETMEFFFNGTDSGTIVQENTSDISDAIDMHNAWTKILSKRYDAKPFHISFMGLPVADCPYMGLVEAYEELKRAQLRYETEQIKVKYPDDAFDWCKVG